MKKKPDARAEAASPRVTRMQRLILRYLEPPHDLSVAVDEMCRRPYEALKALLTFQGPYPEEIHPIDVHEVYLADLITALLKRRPELVAGADPRKIPPGRYMLISAAIEARDPAFAETILAGLDDRSVYTKLLVADGVARRAYLRTPEVKRRLEAILGERSVASSSFLTERFQAALDAFARKPRQRKPPTRASKPATA